jgi:hypothetical protein
VKSGGSFTHFSKKICHACCWLLAVCLRDLLFDPEDELTESSAGLHDVTAQQVVTV